MKKLLAFLLFLFAIAAHAQIPGGEWEYLTTDDREISFVREKERPQEIPFISAPEWRVAPDYLSDVAPEDKMMPVSRCEEEMNLEREGHVPLQVPAPYAGDGLRYPDPIIHPEQP